MSYHRVFFAVSAVICVFLVGALIIPTITPGLGTSTVEAASATSSVATTSLLQTLPQTSSTVPPIPSLKAADLRPRSISIPSISLTRQIIDIGITKTNNLDVPPNFTQVGWYKYGKMPGQAGSTVLDGHVDNGSTTPGPFKRLREVKVGDTITVTTADGSRFTYRVKSSTVVKTTEFPGDFVFHDEAGSLLKIITCHGTFVKSTDTYDRRLIVTAELVK